MSDLQFVETTVRVNPEPERQNVAWIPEMKGTGCFLPVLFLRFIKSVYKNDV
jgi:hypothetical protein